MTIGIFDSGLGGLTVARAVMQELPQERILYFGDTARTPYGNKHPDDITRFAIENTKFLLGKKADAIVVGCNTASAVAAHVLRKEFPSVPIIEVVAPAVREALRVTRNGKIGVLGTRATIKSRAYQKWHPNIQGRECPLFVPLVEAGHLHHPATYEIVKHYVRPMKEAGVDTLILGCTHYPFLKPLLQYAMGSTVHLVDSAETVAKEVSTQFKHLNMTMFKDKARKPLTHEFYVSKLTAKFQELAERWLGRTINLKLAKI